MRDTDQAAAGRPNEEEDGPRQPPRLSPEEIARLEAEEELEDLIEAPPEGDLSIISDDDVPGRPG